MVKSYMPMCFLQVLINMTLGTSKNLSQIVVEQRFGIFSFSAGPDFDNICSAQRKITAMQLKRCGWLDRKSLSRV